MSANPTTVEALRILREARKQVASDERPFMCNAIRWAGDFSALANAMRDRVMDSIRPHYALENWVDERGLPDDPASLRRMRLAYLDAWIAKHEQAIAQQKRGAK